MKALSIETWSLKTTETLLGIETLERFEEEIDWLSLKTTETLLGIETHLEGA